MDDDKNIELSNSSFEVKIKWKKGFLSTPIAIAVGLGALWLFSKNQTVKHFVIFCLFACVVVFVFTIIASVKHDTGDEQQKDNKPAPADKNDADNSQTEVSHAKAKKSSVSKSDKTVNNKVPIPNPGAVRHHGSANPVKQEQVRDTEPVPMDIPQSEEEPVEQTAPSVAAEPVTTEEMTESDWEGFF